ncbi:hypothetical protein FEM48_Zijuj12G0202800 [Ziziphus jujuba var. spinosa]|nr:hypothetical protein FEM48_Zijuj12G0202800 [Ziziphus jujuba var. spinosa]
MEDSMFYLADLSFGVVQEKFVSADSYLDGMKNVRSYGGEDWDYSGNTDSHFPEHFFYNDDSVMEGCVFSKFELQEDKKVSSSEYGLLDDVQFDVVSPPLHRCIEEISKLDEIQNPIPKVEAAKKEKGKPFPLAGLELLNNYGSGFKRLNGERIVEPSNNEIACAKDDEGRELSTEEIVRIAGTRFIQSSSQEVDVASMVNHPFESSFSGLSDEDIKDVELVELLLAAAEKVDYQQFERAGKLLNQCDSLSNNTGNPVQRVIYYFSEALRQKIDRETGRITSKGIEEKIPFDIEEAMMNMSTTKLAYHMRLPFSQVVQFAGTQAIIENVGEARKIHVIDFGIRNGVHWTALMQALASRSEYPLERLKITAVVTKSKHLIENTGQTLVSFAQTMNIPFSFKIVLVSDMVDLKEDLFELDAAEALAVHSKFSLWGMISQPNQLESVMRVIRNLKPCVVVVAEVESNHNSPVFVKRFIEGLFFYGANFDCFDAFMKRDDPNRMIIESKLFGYGIRNMVATEGEERKTRHVKIDVWRAFFSRFGLEEEELSSSSLYQANLVVKNFPHGNSCTLDKNGKSLLIGWKGTPLQSLSVWKFLS